MTTTEIQDTTAVDFVSRKVHLFTFLNLYDPLKSQFSVLVYLSQEETAQRLPFRCSYLDASIPSNAFCRITCVYAFIVTFGALRDKFTAACSTLFLASQMGLFHVFQVARF